MRKKRIVTFVLVVALTVASIEIANYVERTATKDPVENVTPTASPPGNWKFISYVPGEYGEYNHCDIKWFVTFYYDCTILLQPGTTNQLESFFKVQGGATVAAIATTFGTVCTVAGLGLLAGYCVVAGLAEGAYLLWYTAQANNNHQCLRLRYDQLLAPGSPLFNIRFDAYGSWMTWIYFIGSDGLTHRVWWYPTPCHMWRPQPCDNTCPAIMAVMGARDAR